LQKGCAAFQSFRLAGGSCCRVFARSGSKIQRQAWTLRDKFPLAKAQRDALSHFLDARHGDILAVNGPPGTGKPRWCFLLSPRNGPAALEKAEPPVIIATSTNNQAVTNIIEAFGKDFPSTGAMAGRWLPELKSFGAYFPSSTRKAEAAKNTKLKISSTRLSQKSM
jgi:hypothetical protein